MNAAHETHRFGISGFCPGEHDELKAAGPHQLIGGAQRIGVPGGTDEQRTIDPESARDCLRTIDPGGALSIGDGGLARRTEDGGHAAPRFTNGDSAKGKSAVRQRAIELTYPRRYRPRRALRNRNSVRKLLLDESAEGGSGGHGAFRGRRTYPEHTPKAIRPVPSESPPVSRLGYYGACTKTELVSG